VRFETLTRKHENGNARDLATAAPSLCFELARYMSNF